eukprot:GHVN01086677.1.p2 GENE.GHVN01086677.1~~GHVN01086677.1.p2  ORF type:complete len:147 (-),score=19.80 GHVN01086677.1:742-1182(-)
MEVDATTSPPQCVDASPERTSVRGRNVSSRKWKDSSSTKRTSSHSTTLSRGPRLSWEAKKAARMEKQEMKKIESELLSKTARSKKQRHEAIKENRKRRAENEVKTYGKNAQVIKTTIKISKWKKGARQQLVKMSPEMINRLYGAKI